VAAFFVQQPTKNEKRDREAIKDLIILFSAFSYSRWNNCHEQFPQTCLFITQSKLSSPMQCKFMDAGKQPDSSTIMFIAERVIKQSWWLIEGFFYNTISACLTQSLATLLQRLPMLLWWLQDPKHCPIPWRDLDSI